MRKIFLSKLRCPKCKSPLDLTITEETSEIVSGSLRCPRCSTLYPIKKGIPDLLPDLSEDILKEKMLTEKDAALRSQQSDIFNEQWLLNLPEGFSDRRIPADEAYYNGDNVRVFLQAIEQFPEPAGQDLLEVGANICWATRFLAKKGYRCTALDLVSGLYRGLESAEIYIKRENIFFERVLGIMENLPFEDGTYSLLLNMATLHHSGDLNRAFSEIRRVLKPGGRAIVIDSTCGWLISKKHGEQVREMNEYGFNDHTYRYSDYMRAIHNAGFRPRLLFPVSTINKYSLFRRMPASLRDCLLPLLHVVRGFGFTAILEKE